MESTDDRHAITELLRTIRRARPDYGITYQGVRRWLRWNGMADEEAAAVIERLAVKGSIILCAALDDIPPDSPILPNHIRPGDEARIVRALLGGPDAILDDGAGGEVWHYRLTVPEGEIHGAQDRAPARTGVPDTEGGRSALPRQLGPEQWLQRELSFNPAGVLRRDVIVVRNA